MSVVAETLTQAKPQLIRGAEQSFPYDIWLIGGAFALLCIGLLMVVSTSVASLPFAPTRCTSSWID